MQGSPDPNALTVLPPRPMTSETNAGFDESDDEAHRISAISSAHTEHLSTTSSAQGTTPLSRCEAITPSRAPSLGLGGGDGTTEARSDTDQEKDDDPNPTNTNNHPPQARRDGKIELREEDAWSDLGFSFSTRKKWTILTIVFLVQTSMNFNTTLYSNGLAGISAEFGVSMQAARVGAAVFLVAYAFGCELWAPWSEELGRKPILQLSLGLVNVWCVLVALAPNFGALVVGRVLGGLSSAGGSVTLGMIADMFEADEQQNAVAFIVFSSVGGSILGPIVGGFVEGYVEDWRWTIWIQLIFGGVVQLLHLLFVPETRSTILLDRVAKRRRSKGGADANVYGPNELVPFRERFTFRMLMKTWIRPFHMFISEGIVFWLSLLSGFSDALIFMQVQSFALVYRQWGFSTVQIGLSFIPIGIGYIIAWLLFIPTFKRSKNLREKRPGDERAQYESRLWWLLYTAPCLPIGLWIFAWTSGGPPVHWIGTMVGSLIIGIANYAIYMATIDYMICAYGPYSASATGGNGWARDFLAGVLTIPATPFYLNIGPADLHFQLAGTILAVCATILVSAVPAIYWKGPEMRKKSPFAQSLASAQTTDPAGHRHIGLVLPSGEQVVQSHVHGHGHAVTGAVVRPPNPQIVVTEPADTSRPDTQSGQSQHLYGQDDDGEVAEEHESRTALSGETQVGEMEEIGR